MLGTLSKWLRILGYDTLYFTYARDDFLIKLSEKEERILLTKDRKLAEICDSAYLVKSETLKNQLHEVIKAFSLKKQPKSRCTVCNGELKQVEKESVKDKVPFYVYQTHHVFFKCSNCGKIYWKGTHSERIEEFIQTVYRDKDYGQF